MATAGFFDHRKRLAHDIIKRFTVGEPFTEFFGFPLKLFFAEVLIRLEMLIYFIETGLSRQMSRCYNYLFFVALVKNRYTPFIIFHLQMLIVLHYRFPIHRLLLFRYLRLPVHPQ